MHKAIVSGKILASHDVSEGGLITSIFEMCVGGDCGVILSVIASEARNLFLETAGCFILEVENEEIAKKLFKRAPFKILGKTTKDKKIKVDNLFTADIEELKTAWQKPMKEIFS
jgi:phosphoribosylformylglycinamidine synthase